MSSDRPLWIERVRITNFRGYGADFHLSIPPRPGVVLLSGANGLGKTTFFEAIEWALTAQVARLDRLSSASELVRKHPSVDECDVALTFRDGGGLETIVERRCKRTSNSPIVSGTPTDTVVALLRNADERWAVNASNFVRYLFLTHIHPQSAPLRLIAKSADERWGWVSQLAGTERLELVRQRIQGSKNSLTRIAGDRTRVLTSCKNERRAWEDLLDQYQKLRVQATSLAGALTPTDALARVERLIESAKLDVAAARTGDTADTQALVAISASSSALDARKRALEQELALFATRREEVRRWNAARAEAQAKLSLAESINAQVVPLQQQTTARDVELADLRAQLKEAEGAEQQIKQTNDTIIAVLQARTDRHSKTLELERLRAEIIARSGQLETHRADIARLDQELATISAHQMRHNQAEKEQRAISQAATELDTIAPLRAEIDRNASVRLDLQASAAAIAQQQLTLTQDFDEARASLGVAEQRLQELRSAADAVTQSVAIIASHLHQEDEVCPVCTSTFPPGVLKQLATSASQLRHPAIAAAQAAVEQASQALRAVQDQQVRLRRAARANSAESESAAQVELDLTQKIGAVLSSPLVAGVPEDQIAPRLRQRAASLAAELAELMDRRTQLRLDETVALELREQRARHAELERLLQNSKAEELVTTRRVAELLATQQRLREYDLDPNLTDASLQSQYQQNLNVLSSAQVGTESVRSQVDAAVRRHAELRDQLNALAVQERRSREEARDVLARVRALADNWSREFGENPSEISLDKAEADKARDLARLSDGESILREVADGLRAWMQAEQLRDLERNLQEQAEGKTFEQHTDLLEAAVREAESALDNAKKVRAAADGFAEALRARTSAFNERVLAPIQGLFCRYLRALIHDERFHDVGVAPHTEATKGSLHFQLRVPDWETLDEAEAETILSEGQLAELSLAALFAASSAYRWCDWRALLLDDPTQYNDLVHATSLLEVVRNLAHFEGYQVFISTHDIQQAAFFRRKLDAMQIACTECRFTGQTENGIDWVVRTGSATSTS